MHNLVLFQTDNCLKETFSELIWSSAKKKKKRKAEEVTGRLSSGLITLREEPKFLGNPETVEKEAFLR